MRPLYIQGAFGSWMCKLLIQNTLTMNYRPKPKYNNVRVGNFDSKKEAGRYNVLKYMEKIGKVRDVQHHVVFELLPKQVDSNGKTIENAVTYEADFVYFDVEKNMEIVEDVKSTATITDVYKIKRKMMLWFHGIRIFEYI